jgi:hypothetical protein
MPTHKQRSAGTTGKPKADDTASGALKAVQRALLMQTVHVTELRARVNELTNSRQPAPAPPRRDPLTDTEIYWRQRR